MVEGVHTERLLVTVLDFFTCYALVSLVMTVYTMKIIQMFRNTVWKCPLTKDGFLYASNVYWACLSVVGMVYSIMYSLRTPKIHSLGGVLGCYIQLTHTSSIHY